MSLGAQDVSTTEDHTPASTREQGQGREIMSLPGRTEDSGGVGGVGQRLHLGASVRRRLQKGHVEKRNQGREGEDAPVKQVLQCVCQAGVFFIPDHLQTDLVVDSSPRFEPITQF